ncbi:hypothetical protein F0562_024019 [Nyssa sinensis]|uniref:Uncharacterized protein n=1 Tax=Nyssa sinensis TaxID=561372 RepID=A0A5J5BM18_9ASTE|nr:hypothetical protein F0562_024019 [Nyssa sinensis]
MAVAAETLLIEGIRSSRPGEKSRWVRLDVFGATVRSWCSGSGQLRLGEEKEKKPEGVWSDISIIVTIWFVGGKKKACAAEPGLLEQQLRIGEQFPDQVTSGFRCLIWWDFRHK